MDKNDVYNASIDKWGRCGGIGTLSYDPSLDLFEPIKFILNRFFSFNNNAKAIVVVTNAIRIDEWAAKLITGFDHADKLGKENLKFMTADSIVVNRLKVDVDLLLIDQIEKFADGQRLEIIKGTFIKFKYILGATNSPDPDNGGFKLYEYCPVIDRVTKVDVVTKGILDSVIEYNLPVSLNANDLALYKEYSEFIKDTIGMFGDFDMAMKCYHGDARAGISADHFRVQVATTNGWHKDIDTSSQYYFNIDRYFNPNAIYERAQTFAEVIKKRQKLLSDNDAKTQTVLDIIEAHKEKKILIISKRTMYARRLNDAINNKIKGINLKFDKPQGTLFQPASDSKAFTIQSSHICVEYHPDVETRSLIDIDTNDYVRYKSGAKKGAVKQFGATSLNKIANERFNAGFHNVISASNAMPKDANLMIDFIIITSPDCDTLNKFQYRVHRLDFKQNVKIVNIYLEGTKEAIKLKDRHSLSKSRIVTVNNNAINMLEL